MFISVMLIVAALLPAIVLCVYIYKQDRVEKEPLGLLIKLLLGGALICVPLAIIFEVIFSSLVTEPLFERFILGYDSMKNPVFSDSVRHARDFVEYFFGVGLIEEAVKFVVLIWFTRKSREFNSLFDGIIYSFIACVTTSLSLGAAEGGLGTSKLLIVVSRRAFDIVAELSDRVQRGATVFECRGGYTGESKHTVVCVVKRPEL